MSLYSDGKAIDVTADRYLEKDKVAYVEGFHGVAMANASSGDEVALEIALREHTAVVPAELSVAKGDVLYVTAAGVITATSSGNRKFGKATSAKDSNNVITFVLLPQES